MAISIAIVGAGCAALGAATELVGQKDVLVDVTLIDPNDWIGGRARTNPDPALPVDLGPQFIQDPGVNPWTNILQQMPGYDHKNIKPTDVNGCYRIQGENKEWTTEFLPVSVAEANKVLEAGYRIATGFSNAPPVSPEYANIIKGQASWRLAFGSHAFGSIAESAEPWQYLASDRERQGEYDAGHNIYVPGGLGKLVQSYGEKLLTDNSVILHRLQETVIRIDNQSKDRTILKTSDNKKLEADYCIVTVPCSAMAAIRFKPPLPGPRLRADGFIKLGSYKKVAFKPLVFPAGKEDDDKILVNREYYIYDSAQDGIWQYFRLPTDPSILICVTAGDFASLLDGIDDGPVYQSISSLLKSSYPDGHFAPQDGKIVVTNWTKTATIGGAYSYTRPVAELGADNPVPLEARLEIAKPHGRIHFAGEATWPDAYGTIHGAYRSGVRAAREILEAVKSN